MDAQSLQFYAIYKRCPNFFYQFNNKSQISNMFKIQDAILELMLYVDFHVIMYLPQTHTRQRYSQSYAIAMCCLHCRKWHVQLRKHLL